MTSTMAKNFPESQEVCVGYLDDDDDIQIVSVEEGIGAKVDRAIAEAIGAEPVASTSDAAVTNVTASSSASDSMMQKKKTVNKRKRPAADLSTLHKLAAKIRAMTPKQMEKLNERISLSDLRSGTVLEVISIETTQTQFGQMALLKAITSDADRKMKVISAPERFCLDTDDGELDGGVSRAMGIYVYFGKQSMKKGKTQQQTQQQQFHNLKRYEEVFDTVEAMHAKASVLRKMSLDQLNNLLLTIHSFTDMKPGSVLVTDGVRFIDCVNKGGKFQRSIGGLKTSAAASAIAVADGSVSKVPVCRYSALDRGGKEIRGEIFIPVRFSDQIKSLNGVAVVVYRGKKQTKDGKEYSDIVILDEICASLI